MSANVVCRVCLCNNLNLYGVGNELQNVYETITREKFNEAGYPVRMCYICLSALRKCHRFVETARDANSSLKQLYNQQCQIAVPKPLTIYSVSEVKSVSIDSEGISYEYAVKVEKLDLEEQSDVDLQTDPIYVEIEVTPEIEINDEIQLSYANEIPKELNTEVKIEETHKKPEKIDICDICDTIFLSPSSLRRHITMKHPSTQKIENAKITKKKLNCKTDRIKTQSEEKPFSCEFCSYRTSRKSDLNMHIRTHTGEKPFSCANCSYKSSCKKSLTKHMVTHTGVKPFPCDICNLKFGSKTNLRVHMRIHTGEKPFSCDICSYKSTQRSNLRNHKKIHTGVKPYTCNVCGYKCALSTNLTKHLNTHKKQK